MFRKFLSKTFGVFLLYFVWEEGFFFLLFVFCYFVVVVMVVVYSSETPSHSAAVCVLSTL